MAAEKTGHTTVLLYFDPQSSVAEWGDKRKEDTPAVISTHAERISNILDVAEENGASFAILDSALQTEASALDAARHRNWYSFRVSRH